MKQKSSFFGTNPKCFKYVILYVPIPSFSIFFSPTCYIFKCSSYMYRGSRGEDMPHQYSSWQVAVNKHFLLFNFKVCVGSSCGVAFSSHSILLRKYMENFLLFSSLIIAFFQQNDSLLLWIPCACYHNSVNKLTLTLAWHHLYFIFIVTDTKPDRPKETICVSSF